MSMAAAVAQAGPAVPQKNGITYTDQQLKELVAKLTTLRDDIVAGTHPRLKLPAHSDDKGRPQSEEIEEGELPSSLPGLSNSTSRSANTFSTVLPQLSPSKVYSAYPNDYRASSTSAQHHSASVFTASGIDPVLLEKSDTLVNAEAKQKRLRLEQALEAQWQQRKSALRHKTFDEYAVPEFQVEDVLKGAHELVKPVIIHPDLPANGGASSADSFDENTFYSSQMNESTSTEEVAEPKPQPQRILPRRLCKYFLTEQLCPYGESCTFSHDPAMKEKVSGQGSQAIIIDSMNAGKGQHKSPQHQSKKARYDEPKTDSPAGPPISHQERIAQLEAELRAVKEGKELALQQQSAPIQRDGQQPLNYSKHSPRGVDEFGREISLRDRNAQESAEVQQQDRRNLTPQPANNGRVIRNHITTPYAPQPARVSPLAVAKVPQITQVRSNQGQSSQASRLANAEVVGGGQSPNMPLHPLSNRKRRRVRESGEQRNVATRRESSPAVRIKEEPVSPPPFQQARPHLVPEPQLPIYIDAVAPRPRQQEQVIYQTRNPDHPAGVYEVDERAPLAPPPRRIISRNGQHYIAHDEPDLRRVVSERQLRTPISPAPRYAPYSDHEHRAIRAASVYASPTGQRPPVQYGASVQPQYAPQGRSPPPLRQMQSSPLNPPGPMRMAPPPQRIMVDRYGNRFLEPEQRHVSVAPISRPPQYDQYGQRVMEPQVRHVSVAPINHRPQMEQQYEPLPPRSMSVRRTFANEDENPTPQYIRRQPSPSSPQFAEYSSRAKPTQMADPGSGSFGQDPYDGPPPGARVFYQEAQPTPEYRQMAAQREGTYRVQSVRPIEDRYQQISRVQSVQPQQRIVQLGDRQPMSPQIVRQLSVRPDEGFARPVNFAAGGGPQYMYAPQGKEGGYVQDGQEGGMYEPRIVQRM